MTVEAPGTSPDSNPNGESYFAKAKKIYPQSIKGRFRNFKWAFMVVSLGVYYFLPFVRWDRGVGAPDQAVLVDFPARRFYFFFIEIWPQEVYYLTGLLILAALTLFLMNALAGRVWCGYMCFQTVWTDLFMLVERWIEGDRRVRMKTDQEPMTGKRVGKMLLKHTLWLMIAWWTGGAWVLYFADAPTLVKELAFGEAPFVAYLWIGILTATTYVMAGHMREQVCVYMCPWPRIQAALTDEWALNVTYRKDRGEPRGSLKKMKARAAEGLDAGDCVDCGQCVAVCPTGIDIRDGAQLECIQCGLCIDACDNVMDKIGKPRGLVDYDTDINIQRHLEGKESIYRFVRARTIIYVGLITLVVGLMAYTLVNRQLVDLNVLHDRNPLYVALSDGSIRNGFTIRLINKSTTARDFELSLVGAPEGFSLKAVGIENDSPRMITIPIDQDITKELRIQVFAPKGAKLDKSQQIGFNVKDSETGEAQTVTDYFKAP
ncbi:cytochrome c oxidase accessory protein CcoG [Cohaesibacter celericrescens]|uniref:Cytochrome c oxidase accessory protein CcoG n=1 Tax=Cohaesibacter celericrescens TaxID=2067669 RepID=A0A2N5XKD1_9HYPH|nr:cytochrome c oxidase accessory protein CcoG [Cohaesibacter celericrescens]PLW74898.1 cytochrome c oxidase accessory protein CcoG [Cohaesibacter celericrescens]